MSDREEHMRRMIEHGEKRERAATDFERQCRRFWEFLQSAYVRGLTEKESDHTKRA